MDLVEPNTRLWTLVLLVACIGLGVVVLEHLHTPPKYSTGTAASRPQPPIGMGTREAVTEVSLSDLEAYADIADRPLFRKTRRPPEPQPEVEEEQQPAAEKEEEEVGLEELYALIGVVTTPAKEVVLLRDLREGGVKRLLQGGVAGDWSVEGISPDKVAMRSGEKTGELKLVRGPLPVTAKKRKARQRRTSPRRPFRRRRTTK